MTNVRKNDDKKQIFIVCLYLTMFFRADLRLYYDFIDGIRFEYSFNDVLVFRTNDEENEGNIEYINDNIKLLKTYPAGQEFISSVIEKIESIMSKNEEE